MNDKQKLQTMKWKISAKMDISYSVIEHLNLFSSSKENLFGELAKESRRRLVVIDKKVEKLYGDKIRFYFSRHSIELKIVTIEGSEVYKNTETLFLLLKEFDDFKLLRRKEPVIAIGGGVLLDIVGFATNLYRRGVPYIRVPTTLIGIIDAGIGVKTGINFNNHKNRIGTYYQPLFSYIDIQFLATLDKRHISNGLAEVLKIALIKDMSLFKLLEEYGKELLLQKMQNIEISRIIIDKTISGMLEELEPNLWEHNLERLVDFGHTFSGMLEMKSLPGLLHGEAVNMDMALVCVLAHQRGLLTHLELTSIFNVMRYLELPFFNEFCQLELMHKALIDTTYHRDGLQRFPIPISIGKAKFVNDITFKEIESACHVLEKMTKFIQ